MTVLKWLSDDFTGKRLPVLIKLLPLQIKYKIMLFMKTVKFTLSSVALAAALMILSAGASAQENGNRDSLNRIVRGPYETNGAWDNWFVGVGGGINLFEDGWFGAETTHKTRVAPNIEVYVGKWFTPSVGARVGYSGLRANGWVKTSSVFATEFDESRNMFKEKVNFAYIHGDLMWNISNAFSGYKETRFWNVIPYVSVGLLHGYGADGVKAANNQFAMGAGIYNTLRLSDRVNLTLDARQLIFKGTFNGFKGGIAAMSSISLGVSVNLGKTNWKRAVEVPEGYAPYSIEAVNSLKEESENLLARAEKLAAEKEALARANETVKAENGDLRDAVAAAEGRKLAVSSGAVFFAIGKTELDSKGLFQLDFYVRNVIEQDPDAVFVITGYADKDTGSKKRNQYLSEKRVAHVLDILRTKYNVSEDRLIVKAVGAESVFIEGEPELNRCVVLEYAE